MEYNQIELYAWEFLSVQLDLIEQANSVISLVTVKILNPDSSRIQFKSSSNELSIDSAVASSCHCLIELIPWFGSLGFSEILTKEFYLQSEGVIRVLGIKSIQSALLVNSWIPARLFSSSNGGIWISGLIREVKQTIPHKEFCTTFPLINNIIPIMTATMSKGVNTESSPPKPLSLNSLIQRNQKLSVDFQLPMKTLLENNQEFITVRDQIFQYGSNSKGLLYQDDFKKWAKFFRLTKNLHTHLKIPKPPPGFNHTTILPLSTLFKHYLFSEVWLISHIDF